MADVEFVIFDKEKPKTIGVKTWVNGRKYGRFFITENPHDPAIQDVAKTALLESLQHQGILNG